MAGEPIETDYHALVGMKIPHSGVAGERADSGIALG